MKGKSEPPIFGEGITERGKRERIEDKQRLIDRANAADTEPDTIASGDAGGLKHGVTVLLSGQQFLGIRSRLGQLCPEFERCRTTLAGLQNIGQGVDEFFRGFVTLRRHLFASSPDCKAIPDVC